MKRFVILLFLLLLPGAAAEQSCNVNPIIKSGQNCTVSTPVITCTAYTYDIVYLGPDNTSYELRVDDGAMEEILPGTGIYNFTFNETDIGVYEVISCSNNSARIEVRAENPVAVAVWGFNETARTTNNIFDNILGGDIMEMPMLFFTVFAAGLILLGMKTKGLASMPFFALSSLVFVVMGLYIRDTTPFPLLTSEVGVTDIGLLNESAMWFMYAISIIIGLYVGLGVYNTRKTGR